jgi:hypothetical protein
MPQTIANAQARRAYSLLNALVEREITISELTDALRPIPPEVLTVTAMVLKLHRINEPRDPLMQQALTLCDTAANVNRISN